MAISHTFFHGKNLHFGLVYDRIAEQRRGSMENILKNLGQLSNIKINSGTCVAIDNAIELPIDEELSVLTFTPMSELIEKWIFIDGDYYILKDDLDIFKFVNELLGQLLCKHMGLPTIIYHIATKDNKIVGLIGKKSRNPKIHYQRAVTINRNQLREVKKILIDPNYKCNSSTKVQLIAYLLKNYYSALEDRNINSIYARNIDREVILVPDANYSESFINYNMDNYFDPLISWDFNEESIELLRNNPFFEDSLKKIYDINIALLLNYLEEERGITLPDDLKNYYGIYDFYRKEHMKKRGLILK